MIIVHDFGRKELRLIAKTNVDIQSIQDLYDKFYPTRYIKVSTPIYPHAFIQLLFKDTKTICYKPYEIETKLARWFVGQTYRSLLSFYNTFYISKQQTDDTLAFINANNLRKVEPDLSGDKVKDDGPANNVKTVDDIHAPVITKSGPEKDEFTKLFEDVLKHIQSSSRDHITNIVDMTDDLIKNILNTPPDIDCPDAKVEDVSVLPASQLDKHADIPKIVHNSEKNDASSANAFFEKNKVESLQPTVDAFNEILMSGSVTEDIVPYNEGTQLFAKRKTQLASGYLASYVIAKAVINDIKQANNMIVIIFYNKLSETHDMAFFPEKDMIDHLTHLSEFSLDEIEFNTVCFLPYNSLAIELLKYYNVKSNINNLSNYLNIMYKIRKCLLPYPEIHGVFVKTMMEYIYSYYDFDLSSSIDYCVFKEQFEKFNIYKLRMQLNIVLDNDSICNILKYLGFTITADHILYLKKKTTDIPIDMQISEKISAVITATSVAKAFHDIRGPVTNNSVNLLPNVSAWQISSKIQINHLAKDISRGVNPIKIESS